MDNGYEGGSAGYAPASDFSNGVAISSEETFASSGEFYIEGEPVVSEQSDIGYQPDTVSEETHSLILEDVKMNGIEVTLQALADGKYLDNPSSAESFGDGQTDIVADEEIETDFTADAFVKENGEDGGSEMEEITEESDPQLEEEELPSEESDNLEKMLEDFNIQNEEIMNELEELGLELDEMLEQLKKLIEVITALKQKLEEVTELYHKEKEKNGEDDPKVQKLAVLIEQIQGLIAKITGSEGGEA